MAKSLKQTLLGRNDSAMRRFKNEVLKDIAESSSYTMKQVAIRMLEQAISEADYNDYSGEMINSYQVGLYKDGAYMRIIGTSEGMPGTSNMYSEEAGEMLLKRTKRGPGPEAIHNLRDRSGEGYGKRNALLKAWRPRTKSGYSITMMNPTPYLDDVAMGSSKYSGQFMKRTVMPSTFYRVDFVVEIFDKTIKNRINKKRRK